jgi:hypothetical protein
VCVCVCCVMCTVCVCVRDPFSPRNDVKYDPSCVRLLTCYGGNLHLTDPSGKAWNTVCQDASACDCFAPGARKLSGSTPFTTRGPVTTTQCLCCLCLCVLRAHLLYCNKHHLRSKVYTVCVCVCACVCLCVCHFMTPALKVDSTHEV